MSKRRRYKSGEKLAAVLEYVNGNKSYTEAGKIVGIFNAAFIELGDIHTSRTAAAMQGSEFSPVFWRGVINSENPCDT